MALGDFVYPPILNSSQPAYDINDYLAINFTIPAMVSTNDIGSIGITIVNQSNNVSVVTGDPGDDILYFNFSDCIKIDNLTNTYSIVIDKDKYLLQAEDKYKAGNLYKVQMRFCKDKILGTDEAGISNLYIYESTMERYIDNNMISFAQTYSIGNWANISNQYKNLIDNKIIIPYSTQLEGYIGIGRFNWLKNWKEQTEFSDWSSVMLIKPITPPKTFINTQSTIGSLGTIFEDLSSIERSLNPMFTGVCSFDNEAEKEVESAYKFVLYENKIVKNDSGWLIHKANDNFDSHTFGVLLKEKVDYIIEYTIKTNNGYISPPVKHPFVIKIFDSGNLETTELRTNPNHEDGYMEIYLNNTSNNIINGNFILSRASEESKYQQWEELGYVPTTIESGEHLVYKDFTVESGMKYLYALTEEIRQGDYINYKSPLYEGYEGKLDDSQAKAINFEYAFLYANGKQLKLKFNNKMSSFKKSVLASKQDVIGSQYPVILRNGQAYYAEFPITGLISLQMDDNQTFFTLGEEGYYYDNDLIIPKDKLQNRNYRESTNTKQSCSPWASTDLVDDNIFIERKFREKVEEFLNNGECKLYRSPTEGNFIVNLLNISFTPNQTLGRMIYEFNSTAYEIADNTINSLQKLGILNYGKYTEKLNSATNQFGQVILSTEESSTFNENNLITECKINLQTGNVNTYTIKLQYKDQIPQTLLLNSALDYVFIPENNSFTITNLTPESEIVINWKGSVELEIENKPEIIIQEAEITWFDQQYKDTSWDYSSKIAQNAIKAIVKKLIPDSQTNTISNTLTALNNSKYRILKYDNSGYITTQDELSKLYHNIKKFSIETDPGTTIIVADTSPIYLNDGKFYIVNNGETNMPRFTCENRTTTPPYTIDYIIKIIIQEVM